MIMRLEDLLDGVDYVNQGPIRLDVQRMTRIIGLAGVKQSGKDTVAKTLVDEYGFVRLAFADAIRQAAYELDPILDVSDYGDHLDRLQDVVDSIGWDRAKNEWPEIRRILQVLGTESIRALQDDFWISVVTRQIQPDKNYVITDVRYPNEIDAILELGGEVFKVKRGAVAQSGDLHPSETALLDYDLPEIDNNGTLTELEREVQRRVFGQ